MEGELDKIKNEKYDFNDSGIIEDDSDDVLDMSAYERIREENIKERKEMWNYLGLAKSIEQCKSSPAFKKVEKRKSSQNFEPKIARKSARLAAKTDAVENSCENELKSIEFELKKLNSAIQKRERRKFKLQYFSETSLQFSLSFTSCNSSKKLFVHYWN